MQRKGQTGPDVKFTAVDRLSQEPVPGGVEGSVLLCVVGQTSLGTRWAKQHLSVSGAGPP